MNEQSQDKSTEDNIKNIDNEDVDTVEPSWKERLLSVEHWLRFVFMVLFIVILSIVSYLIVALVILQFLWALVTGESNDKLRSFGGSVACFIHQVLGFLTYNSDDKPFPFSDWPGPEKNSSVDTVGED